MPETDAYPQIDIQGKRPRAISPSEEWRIDHYDSDRIPLSEVSAYRADTITDTFAAKIGHLLVQRLLPQFSGGDDTLRSFLTQMGSNPIFLMKFNVLALDYDGTIASHGQLNPQVATAIRDARAIGITVVLVTGRILSDLQRVMKEDDLFDAIVAENGAVMTFPNGWTRVLGRSPSKALLSKFCDRGIEIAFGDCIVEADAGEAPKILKVIKEMQLPLMLVFNHGRVMVLPQGITKASGLQVALDTMRLSLHNCIGIGDGENDHPLLDACEIGVAVCWGSKALQGIADHVLEGDGPEALAGYIRELSLLPKVPPQRAKERSILLGESATGPVRTSILGRNILVAGDPRSGKSWIAGLFAEDLLLHGYCLCVIDPEGDYATLESLPGVVLFNDVKPPRLSDVTRALRHPNTSIVIDLSSLSHAEKLNYVHDLLPALFQLRLRTGLPHWIVVDEAHYFLNQPDTERWIDFELAAYVFITYRPSHLHPALLEATGTIIVTPLTDPDEVVTLTKLNGTQGTESEWGEALGELRIDEAAIVPRHASEGRLPLRFTIAPRLTSHVRHRAKYIEVPMPTERAFHFTCNGRNFGAPARTLKEFITLQARLPPESIEGHAQRGDFSLWIAKVFGDQPLANAIRHVEEHFRQGQIEDLSEALKRPILDRYDLVVD